MVVSSLFLQGLVLPFHNFITVSHLENVKVQKYVFRFCLCGCCGGGVVTEWAHHRLTPSMVILSSSLSCHHCHHCHHHHHCHCHCCHHRHHCHHCHRCHHCIVIIVIICAYSCKFCAKVKSAASLQVAAPFNCLTVHHCKDQHLSIVGITINPAW